MPEYELKPDDVAQIRRFTALFRDFFDQIRRWGEIINSLPAQMDLMASAIREASEDEADAIRDLKAQVKRLEELELLRQAGRDDSGKAKKLRVDIQNEHSLEHLQDMLITVTKNLQRAQLKKARAGSNVSYEVENDIEEFTAAKEEIERQLKELKALTTK